MFAIARSPLASPIIFKRTLSSFPFSHAPTGLMPSMTEVLGTSAGARPSLPTPLLGRMNSGLITPGRTLTSGLTTPTVHLHPSSLLTPRQQIFSPSKTIEGGAFPFPLSAPIPRVAVQLPTQSAPVSILASSKTVKGASRVGISRMTSNLILKAPRRLRIQVPERIQVPSMDPAELLVRLHLVDAQPPRIRFKSRKCKDRVPTPYTRGSKCRERVPTPFIKKDCVWAD